MLRKADEETAVGGLQEFAVEVGAGGDGEEPRGPEERGVVLTGLEGAGDCESSDAGSNGGGGELHDDDCWWR